MGLVVSCGGDGALYVSPPSPPDTTPVEPAQKPAQPTFLSPVRIAPADNGEFAVTDKGRGAVVFINSTLKETGTLYVPGTPSGVAVHGNTVFVGNNEGSNANAFSRSGRYMYTLGSADGYGLVGYPTDISLDVEEDRVFVLDGAAKQVKSYMLNGTSVAAFPGAGGLHYPSAMTVDTTLKLIYVCDYWEFKSFGTANARVNIYDYSGALQGTIDSTAMSDVQYQFSRPQGLSLNSNGNLYITDIVLGKVLLINTTTKQGLSFLQGSDFGVSGAFMPLDVLVDAAGDVYITRMGISNISVARGAGL